MHAFKELVKNFQARAFRTSKTWRTVTVCIKTGCQIRGALQDIMDCYQSEVPKIRIYGEAVLTEATRDKVLEFYPARREILPLNMLRLPDDRRPTFSNSRPNKTPSI
jgi:hypothetical protein